LDKLAQEDAELLRLMNEVFHLAKPISILQQEPLRSRVLNRFANCIDGLCSMSGCAATEAKLYV
jgi:hypothetical protein